MTSFPCRRLPQRRAASIRNAERAGRAIRCARASRRKSGMPPVVIEPPKRRPAPTARNISARPRPREGARPPDCSRWRNSLRRFARRARSPTCARGPGRAKSAPDGDAPGFDHPNTTHYSIVDRLPATRSRTHLRSIWCGGVGLVAEGNRHRRSTTSSTISPPSPARPTPSALIGLTPTRTGPEQAAAVLDDADHRAQGRQAASSVTGSPGGSRIITAVLQILSQRDRSQAWRIAEAVAAPAHPSPMAARRSRCRTPDSRAAALRCAGRRAATTSRLRRPSDVGQLDPGDARRLRRRRRHPHRAARWRRGIESKGPEKRSLPLRLDTGSRVTATDPAMYPELRSEARVPRGWQ